MIVLVLVGHLRRTGIGRTIIGVRENEPAAAALTVSPTRAKLTAFALGGFIAGLGGALSAGSCVTIGYSERFFRVEDSLTLVAIAVIGGLGSLAGAVIGALWVVGLPAFWPDNEIVPLLTSSIGLLIILLTSRAASRRSATGSATQLLALAREAAAAGAAEDHRPRRRCRCAGRRARAAATQRRRQRARDARAHRARSAASSRSTTSTSAPMPGEVIGLIGTNGAGQVDAAQRDRRLRAQPRGTVELLGTRRHRTARAHRRARLGLGRTFQAATLFPELTVRETVQLALEARQRDVVLGHAAVPAAATRLERPKRAEAAELIDFLGLGRYADRFIAELSTGTRRIVELASVLAVAPRVICLDEPTAGVAQREAEAFGPLIKRVQQELDATLVVVEHDLPLILSISDRVYCLEAGRRDRRGRAATRCATTRSSSRRTSAPTSGRRCGPERPSPTDYFVTSTKSVSGLQSPTAGWSSRTTATGSRRRASYFPSSATRFRWRRRRSGPKLLTAAIHLSIVRFGPAFVGDLLEHS